LFNQIILFTRERS